MNTTKKVNVELPQELFSRIQELSSYKDRESVLATDGNSFVIKTILQLAYNDKIVLDLPEGSPPINAENVPLGMTGSNYRKVLQKLKYLTPSSTAAKIKKEGIFLDLLQSMHPEDAKIIVAAKDKKLDKLYPKVSKNLVTKIFPELLK